MNTRERNTYLYEQRQYKRDRHEIPETPVKIVELQKGQTYKHNLDESEIVFICKGRIRLSFGSKVDKILDRGRLTLLPPGAFVTMVVMEDTRMCTCKLTWEMKINESLRVEELYPYTPQNGEFFKTLVMKKPIARFLHSLIPCIEDDLLGNHFIQIKMNELMHLLRAYYSRDEVAAFFYPLLGPDFAFRIYIYSHAAIVQSVKELAAGANMSERGFLQRFKRTMKGTPAGFMIRQKASRIYQDLLYTNIPIKEISDKYGFSGVQSFTTFCKKNLQNSPAKIRKENNISE